MKLMMATIVLVASFHLTVQIALAEIKTFTKEYTYQASELDSKSTSRTLALEQAKRMLLEELGVFLTSHTEVVNSALTKDQITSITAGIVSAEVLDERWDGHNYWLKAKIDADPTVVKQAIDVIASDTKKTSELEAARKRIAELTNNLKAVKNDPNSTPEERKIKYTKVVNQKQAMDWLVTFFNTFNEKKSLTENKEALDAIEKAIEIDPDFSVSYFMRAYIYGEIAKDTQKAIDDISKAIKLHAPGTPNTLLENTAGYYEYRARLYLRQGKHQQAFSDLMTALEIDPTQILMPFGEWKAADLDAFVKNYPKDYRVYIFRGRYHSHFISRRENPKAYDMAISDLKKAQKMNTKNPVAYYILVDPYLYKLMGFYSKRTGAQIDTVTHQKIIDLATSGLKLNISKEWQKRFLTERAVQYAKLGKYKQAIMDYDELEKLDPDHGGTYYDRGLAKISLKDYSAAIADFENAIKAKKPITLGNAWAYEQIGDAYAEQGMTADAILNFTKGIDLVLAKREADRALNYKGIPLDFDYTLAGIFEKRGMQYKANKEQEKALSDYSDAIRYSMGATTALEKRCDLLNTMGRYEEALADIDEMMKSHREYNMNPAELYNKRAVLYTNKGDIKNAINDYDMTLFYAKGFVGVYEQRGSLYLNLGNSEQALKDFNEYVKAYPKDAKAYELRGAAYANTGNDKKALEDLNYSISLNPKSEQAYHFRAIAYKNMGDIVRANNDFRVAARLGHKPAQDFLKTVGETW